MSKWPLLPVAAFFLILGALSTHSNAAHDTLPTVSDGGFKVSANLDDSAFDPSAPTDRYLVVEVTAPQRGSGARHPVDVSLVIDASGSMAADGKFAAAQQAAKALVSQLNPQDTLSVLTFSETAAVIARQTPVADRGSLRARIDQISLGGGTHLHAGLSEGFAQVLGHERQAIKRVMVLSDGHANIGITDPTRLAAAAGAYTSSGVTVSTLGLGLDFNEDVMLAMSKSGGGTYQFVNDPASLAESFKAELGRITQVAGREMSLEVIIGDHFELMEVYAHDASVNPMGFGVFLGDMHSGEVRKIVARVRPSPGAAGSIPVAKVNLSFADPDTGHTGSAHAVADAVMDASQRLPNAEATEKAAEAVMGWSLDQSVRSWANGDAENSGSVLAAGRDQLRALQDHHQGMTGFADAVELFTEELDEQEVQNELVAPASMEGETMKKARKLDALGYMQ